MRRVRILMYHRVEYLNDDYNMQAVTPTNFEKHMRYLRDHYEMLRLDDPMESWFQNQSGDAVIVTFDDGYYDFLQNAVPIMEKYDIPATVFVSTGNIDTQYENWTDSILRAVFSDVNQRDSYTFEAEYYRGRFSTGNWEEKYKVYKMIRELFIVSSAARRKQYEQQLLEWAGLTKEGRRSRKLMTTEELLETSTRKGISIGAHTVTHCSLKHQEFSEQQYEIRESKRILEEITGQKVKLFAYPFGTKDNYSDVTIKLLQEAGFEKAVVAFPDAMSENTNIYELNRFMVKNYDENDFGNYMNHVVFQDEKLGHSGNHVPTGKQVDYVGVLQEDSILTADNPLVIWGAGYSGRALYTELAIRGLDNRIVAFGDNDDEKFGNVLENKPVLDCATVKEMQKDNDCHILVKGNYAFEICKGLLREKVRNLHLII